MDFKQLVAKFTDIGQAAIPLLAAIALFVFFLGIARFIRSAGNETERKNSKYIIIWGVIGMFIMFSIWGIIAFLKVEFNFTGPVGIPQLPTNFPLIEDVHSTLQPCGEDRLGCE